MSFTKLIEKPLKWSAEEPNSYTLLITVLSNNEVVQVILQKIGFRKIELKGEVFLVNGVAIKFKGVNRHDYSQRNGRVVSRDELIKDIVLMKQHNINTIRTAQYPKSYYYMIYVMNMECI